MNNTKLFVRPCCNVCKQLQVIDANSSYKRVLGVLTKKDDSLYHFKRTPFTARLKACEEEELCYLLDEWNNGGYYD